MTSICSRIGLSWPFSSTEHKGYVADDSDAQISSLVSACLKQDLRVSYESFIQNTKVREWTHLQGDDPLLHLAYYAEWDSSEHSPWSLSDVTLFQQVERAQKCTRLWFKVAIGATISLPLAFWGAVYNGALDLSTAAMIQSISMGLFTVVTVGSTPDEKGDLARRQQDQIQAMRGKLQRMILRLLELVKTHPRLAAEIAVRIRKDEIKDSMGELSDPLTGDLASLQEVCSQLGRIPKTPASAGLERPRRDSAVYLFPQRPNGGSGPAARHVPPIFVSGGSSSAAAAGYVPPLFIAGGSNSAAAVEKAASALRSLALVPLTLSPLRAPEITPEEIV